MFYYTIKLTDQPQQVGAERLTRSAMVHTEPQDSGLNIPHREQAMLMPGQSPEERLHVLRA